VSVIVSVGRLSVRLHAGVSSCPGFIQMDSKGNEKEAVHQIIGRRRSSSSSSTPATPPPMAHLKECAIQT